jgi:prephenate dehydrogenase
MWRDVCIANRAALLTEIDAYTKVLARFREAIDASDGAALEAAFERSRTARSVWQQGGAIKAADDSAQ